MAYKPIAEAGIPFTFSQIQSTPAMNGSSVVAGTPLPGPSWSIAFDDDVSRNVRVTIGPYSSQRVQGSELPSYFEFTAGEEPEVRVTNAVPENADEFIPSPVTGFASRFVYQAGFGSELFRDEQYEMLVEVEGSRLRPIIPIKQTFRGFLGSDNSFSTWVRTAEGRANLGGAQCAVRVYRYDHHAVQVELPADGDAQGQFTFALPQAVAMRSLGPGVFRLEMLLIDGGVSQVAQLGILELV